MTENEWSGRLGPSSRAKMASALVAVMGAAVLVVATGMILGVRGGNLATLVLCVLTAIFSLVPVVLIRNQPAERRNVLMALFCLAYVARYVIPPMILYVPERLPVDAPAMAYSQLRPWDVASGQLLILIALIAFLLGHLVPLWSLVGKRTERPPRDWPATITLSVGIGLILIGWPVSTAATLGFIPTALGSGVISTIGSSLVFGHVLLALAYFRNGMRIALILMCITIPITSLIGFLSGSKTSTILAPTFIAMTYVFEKRRIPVSFVAAAVLALAVIYPASEFLRVYMLGSDFRFTSEVILNPGSSASEVTNYVKSRGFGDYLADGFSSVGQRFDSTGVVSVIVRDTPRLTPYQHGSTLILFFVSFVPRVIWPEKPNVSIGQFITDVYGSGSHIESSTAPSQIGDYYLNFGYPGVIIGMFGLGVMLRLAGDLFLGRRSTATSILMATAIAYCVVIGFEMNVAIAQSRIFFFVVPIAALHFMVHALGGDRSVASSRVENGA